MKKVKQGGGEIEKRVMDRGQKGEGRRRGSN